jgi:DNA-binding response OmpR family regulator
MRAEWDRLGPGKHGDDRADASSGEQAMSNTRTPPTFCGETSMSDRRKVIAYSVDPASLASLRQAFPEFQVEVLDGASTNSLTQDSEPVRAELLVVGIHTELSQTLGLCRGLRSQAGRARTPLLVVVPTRHSGLVRAALEAGADSCLVLPVHPKELVNMLARAKTGNRPERHTLDLQKPQRQDPWRDDGGEA